jgi:DNA polymerase-3 subunit delta
MSYEEILRAVEKGDIAPLYLLHGEEPYFIDQIEAAIAASALTEAERGFNEAIFYGKDADAKAMLDALRRYPMMSQRQLVILREAQDMRTIAQLDTYASNPMPSTVFVVCYKHKKLDMRTAFGKQMQAKGVVLESKKLYDEQVPGWVAGYCKSKKCSIDAQAVQLVADYLGADLARIANEIDKLALVLPAGATINAEHVQEYIGISKDFNVFELRKALAGRHEEKVFQIARYFASNIRKNPLVLTINNLFDFFSKVYMLYYLAGKPGEVVFQKMGVRSDWFLKDHKVALQHFNLEQLEAVIHILHEYDLKSKGVGADHLAKDEGALMTELFYHIMHA